MCRKIGKFGLLLLLARDLRDPSPKWSDYISHFTTVYHSIEGKAAYLLNIGDTISRMFAEKIILNKGVSFIVSL